jgi:hypothetical protein
MFLVTGPGAVSLGSILLKRKDMVNIKFINKMKT